LTATILTLRRIFRDHYEGPKGSRRKRGAFQYRADCEKRELEFVEVALLDADIIKIGSVDLPRLFRDPRSIPQEK
jgi:hypothetical protein